MKQKSHDNHNRPMTEHHFAEFIAQQAEMYLLRTPASYALNYALVDRLTGKIAAWLEVTCCRGTPSSDFVLNLTTWMNGIDLTHQTGKPFLIGYRWENRDYLLQIQDGDIPMVLVNSASNRCDTTNDTENHQLPDVLSANHSPEIKPEHRRRYVVKIPKKLFHTIS